MLAAYLSSWFPKSVKTFAIWDFVVVNIDSKWLSRISCEQNISTHLNKTQRNHVNPLTSAIRITNRSWNWNIGLMMKGLTRISVEQKNPMLNKNVESLLVCAKVRVYINPFASIMTCKCISILVDVGTRDLGHFISTVAVKGLMRPYCIEENGGFKYKRINS